MIKNGNTSIWILEHCLDVQCVIKHFKFKGRMFCNPKVGWEINDNKGYWFKNKFFFVINSVNCDRWIKSKKEGK